MLLRPSWVSTLIFLLITAIVCVAIFLLKSNFFTILFINLPDLVTLHILSAINVPFGFSLLAVAIILYVLNAFLINYSLASIIGFLYLKRGETGSFFLAIQMLLKQISFWVVFLFFIVLPATISSYGLYEQNTGPSFYEKVNRSIVQNDVRILANAIVTYSRHNSNAIPSIITQIPQYISTNEADICSMLTDPEDGVIHALPLHPELIEVEKPSHQIDNSNCNDSYNLGYRVSTNSTRDRIIIDDGAEISVTIPL